MGSGFRDYNQVNNLLNPDPAVVAFDVAANLALAGATRLAGKFGSEIMDSFYSQGPSLRGSQSQPSETSGNIHMMEEDGISIDSQGTCKRARYSNTQTLGVSDFVNAPTNIIGAANSLSLGNNIEKAIICKLNASVNSPKLAYEYLLKHMLGSGRIELTWAGSMHSQLNKRHRHYECFRHNLYNTNAVTASDAYPVSMSPYILSPKMDFHSEQVDPLGYPQGNNMSGVGWKNFNVPELDSSGNPISGEGKAYYVALNRPDYEDMMWNLNRLKLATVPSVGGTPPTDTGFAGDVAQMKQNYHRGRSEIFLNNVRKAEFEPQASEYVFQGSSYRYNSLFKNGTVSYQFMNKGIAPAKIELVVLKVRKQAQGIVPCPKAVDPADFTPVFNGVITDYYESPVANGYLQTIYNKFGTDDLQGRKPQASDVLDDARYPFVPKLKKTDKSECAFTEVQRISFVATSGSRRNVKIQLGGKVYDPTNVAQKTNPNANLNAPVALDDHTYVIGISCCGCRASRIIEPEVETLVDPTTGEPTGNPTSHGAGIIGDVHSHCLVQYYASYVEEIGAMTYKDPGYGKIYVGGAMIQPDDLGYLSNSTAGVILPQSQTVRIPTSQTRNHKGVSQDLERTYPATVVSSTNRGQKP